MKVIPFGEVKKNRFEIAKEKGLIEQVASLWRLTSKCKEKYDDISFIKYLQGKEYPPKKSDKDQVIREILNM
jgi:hypothetical protein